MQLIGAFGACSRRSRKKINEKHSAFPHQASPSHGRSVFALNLNHGPLSSALDPGRPGSHTSSTSIYTDHHNTLSARRLLLHTITTTSPPPSHHQPTTTPSPTDGTTMTTASTIIISLLPTATTSIPKRQGHIKRRATVCGCRTRTRRGSGTGWWGWGAHILERAERWGTYRQR